MAGTPRLQDSCILFETRRLLSPVHTGVKVEVDFRRRRLFVASTVLATKSRRRHFVDFDANVDRT